MDLITGIGNLSIESLAPGIRGILTPISENETSAPVEIEITRVRLLTDFGEEISRPAPDSSSFSELNEEDLRNEHPSPKPSEKQANNADAGTESEPDSREDSLSPDPSPVRRFPHLRPAIIINMNLLPWPTFKGTKYESADEYIESLSANLELMTLGTAAAPSPAIRLYMFKANVKDDAEKWLTRELTVSTRTDYEELIKAFKKRFPEPSNDVSHRWDNDVVEFRKKEGESLKAFIT